MTLSTGSAIASHPLGVKPRGNAYFLKSGEDARISLGPSMAVLTDDALLVLLEYLDATSLIALGSTCRFLYAFCHYDELWKSLFLKSPIFSRESIVNWRGSWRSTLLQLPDDHQIGAPIDCRNVFSDTLHRPFVCSQIDLTPYAAQIPPSNQIPRFENLSHEEFASTWSRQPFILTKAVDQWPACREWTLDVLLERYSDVVFRAEAVDWSFGSYYNYIFNNNDESPLYLFDRIFVEKMGISVASENPYSRLEGLRSPETDESGIAQKTENEPSDVTQTSYQTSNQNVIEKADHEHCKAMYWKPECFGPDLFEVLGSERPAHRWLITGPARSGSTFHKDPNATSAWNAVVQGAKYWIMLPPTASVPGVYVSADSSEVTSPLSIAEWLLEFHEETRHHPQCREGICREGEILHVPSGWWHLVVNLEAGIAITQNFVPQTANHHHLVEAFRFLRDKTDQVSGFKKEVTNPYDMFIERLALQYPKLLDEAQKIMDERTTNKKRRWEETVALEEVEEGPNKEARNGGSFSFGFALSDDEE